MKLTKKLAIISLAAFLGLSSGFFVESNPTIVQAKSKKRVVKKTRRTKKRVVKKIAKKHYVTSTIKLPAGYTRAQLLRAYKNKPTAHFIKICMNGMRTNNFSSNKASESAEDDRTKVDLANLTTSQKSELTNYSLRLINNARKSLKLKPWKKSNGVMKLAEDIAYQYRINNRSIKTGHYTAGIVKACQENGLNLNDNYVEDMAGFYSKSSKTTMTQLKKDIYFGLKQMIFGYAGSSDRQISQRRYYREWQHAGDLFNTQGSKHDGDFNYYGFSISKTGSIYSMHFISIPSFIIKSKVYNLNFQL